MLFVHGIHSPQRVQRILDRVLDIIEEETVLMEWTAEGNSFRNQYAIPLDKLHDACVIFLQEELLGQPKANRTTNFLYR